MISSKIKVSRIIFSILALACMIVIFCFSRENSDKSSKTSGRVTDTVIDVAIKDYKKKTVSEQHIIRNRVTFWVRKTAHFSLYACLGFCVSMAVGKRKYFSFATLASLVFCFLYAASDEFHQHFVSGRSAEFRDVMIDTGGALTGIAASLVLMSFISFILTRCKKTAE